MIKYKVWVMMEERNIVIDRFTEKKELPKDKLQKLLDKKYKEWYSCTWGKKIILNKKHDKFKNKHSINS